MRNGAEIAPVELAAEREAFDRVTQAARIRRDEDARQHQAEVRRQAQRIWALAQAA